MSKRKWKLWRALPGLRRGYASFALNAIFVPAFAGGLVSFLARLARHKHGNHGRSVNGRCMECGISACEGGIALDTALAWQPQRNTPDNIRNAANPEVEVDA